MKKLLIATLLVSVFVVSSSGAEKLKNKDVIGEWKYEVTSAPQGYESGTLVFEEKEGKLTGKVKFSAGYDSEFSKVEIENDVLKFGLYVDYEHITGEAQIDGKKMKGSVNTPDGKIELKAEKIK